MILLVLLLCPRRLRELEGSPHVASFVAASEPSRSPFWAGYTFLLRLDLGPLLKSKGWSRRRRSEQALHRPFGTRRIDQGVCRPAAIDLT